MVGTISLVQTPASSVGETVHCRALEVPLTSFPYIWLKINFLSCLCCHTTVSGLPMNSLTEHRTGTMCLVAQTEQTTGAALYFVYLLIRTALGIFQDRCRGKHQDHFPAWLSHGSTEHSPRRDFIHPASAEFGVDRLTAVWTEYSHSTHLLVQNRPILVLVTSLHKHAALWT